MWRQKNREHYLQQRRVQDARYRAANRPKAQVQEPMPILHVGHDLFDQARELVATHTRMHPDNRRLYLDPLYDDLISVATLAILEGSDPETSLKTFLHDENRWRWSALPLLEEHNSIADPISA
jgi:hypothetical protein